MTGAWRLLLVLLYLAAGAAAASPLDVAGAAKLILRERLEILRDASGTMDFAAARDAYAAGRFAPLSAGNPSLGYLAGATWAHVTVANSTAAPAERWLEIGGSYQQRCALHVATPDGAVTVMENGASVPIAERPLPSRRLLFPLTLAPGATVDLYLRFSGRTATLVDPVLWQPAAYADAEASHMAYKYLAGGTTSAVLIFGFLAWRARRQIAMLGAGIGNLLLVGTAMLIDGFAAGWLPADAELWQSRLIGTAAFLGLAGHVVFARRFLSLPERAPALARLLVLLAGTMVALAALPLFFLDPHLVNGIGIPAALSLFSLAVASAAWRGLPNARSYLAAWSLLWLVAILRALHYHGGFRDIPLLSDLPFAALVISSILLAYAIHRDMETAREYADTAIDRILAVQFDEQERLATAVEARTQELQSAIGAAEAGNRAMSAFLSTMSHEARTSLHTILGYARMLRAGAATETDTRLAIIENSGKQLLRLINDVIEFGRGQANAVTLHPEPMSLAALASHLEDSCRLLAAERENRFTISLADDLPAAIEGDEQRLAQVLQNLVANACKFTAAGDVRLSVFRDGSPETVAGERWYTIGFEVSDTGSGIAPEDQERVFEPFYRVIVAHRQPGVGLGLAIARQIVRAMGADIALASAPGAGSRFSFRLRLKEAPEQEIMPARPEQDRIDGLRGRPRTFLIVDDIQVNRSFLRELCSSWGVQVREAQNGIEALAACREMLPDAILADQFMPEMDGWTLLRTLRENPRTARLPVFLISAAPPRRPKDFPAEIDFDGMLMKPVDQNALARMLEERLGIEWIRSASQAAPSAAGTLTLPCTGRLAELQDMLALGQIPAIEEWAEALALETPTCRSFADEVRRLCGAVDLAGLRRLLDSAGAPMHENHTQTKG